MGHHKYKETERVAHIDCLDVPMRVCRFIREKKMVPVPNTDKKKEKMFLIAIECEWFENGILKKGKFNSKVLVPFESVAKAGKMAALAWLEDNFKK